MESIIRFRNRQAFTKTDDGSWSVCSPETGEQNINELLKNGHKVTFSSPLTAIDLMAVNSPEFIVKSVCRPHETVELFEGDTEINLLIERLIEKELKMSVTFY